MGGHEDHLRHSRRLRRGVQGSRRAAQLAGGAVAGRGIAMDLLMMALQMALCCVIAVVPCLGVVWLVLRGRA